MYHIMLCDDHDDFLEYIEKVILDSGVSSHEVHFLRYYSGEELIAAIDQEDCCDLLILDMQMKQLDGHATAKIFRQKFRSSTLVFCSGVCSPTVESFEVSPFRYLLKSYTREHMIKEMEAIVREMVQNKKEPFIRGHNHHNIIRLMASDILFIENTKHGSDIHARKEILSPPFDKRISSFKKLKDFYPVLKDFGFVYPHNSYLVNLKYVVRVTNKIELNLTDGTVLSISRSRMPQFMQELTNYLSIKYD